MFVDDFRDRGIFVTLAIENVAPVAPHGSNIEQDGLVLRFGSRKCFIVPLVPVNRLVRGGAKIGARRIL
jgi:hypothetical protein